MGKTVYARTLPNGRYSIGGVAVGNVEPIFFKSYDTMECLQLQALRTQVGLRLQMSPEIMTKIELSNVHSEDGIREFLMTHQRLTATECPDDVTKLLMAYPQLAVAGRLAGYKIYKIDILANCGRALLYFYDAWTNNVAEMRLILDPKGGASYVDFAASDEVAEKKIDSEKVLASPAFVTYAMGENGMTCYHYCGLVDGAPQIREKSESHERVVTLKPNGGCEIEEIIAEHSDSEKRKI